MDTYPLKESIPKRLRLNFVHELYAELIDSFVLTEDFVKLEGA